VPDVVILMMMPFQLRVELLLLKKRENGQICGSRDDPKEYSLYKWDSTSTSYLKELISITLKKSKKMRKIRNIFKYTKE